MIKKIVFNRSTWNTNQIYMVTYDKAELHEAAKQMQAPVTPAAKKSKHVSGKRLSIEEFLARHADSEGEDVECAGKIVTILRLYREGYTRSEIVAAGFNRSTVYRQCGELNKLRKGPITSYYGFEAYEGRINRVMSRKKMTREQAIDYIAEQDMGDDADA